jgi:hypothetical protein
MPMNESAAREIALLLYDEPLAKVFELKAVSEDVYGIRFIDRRDGTVLEVAQVLAWIDPIRAGRVLQPDYSVCDVCDRLHGDRDTYGELRDVCRSCLIELLENQIAGDQP